MMDSRCSIRPVDRFNIVDATPFKRDPVAELAQACRKHGLLFGLYYSQSLDWHERDAGGHGVEYGANHENMSWSNDWDFPDHRPNVFARYLERKVKPQLTELLTHYGAISHLWFDTPLTITAEQSAELYALAKRLQPDVLINSRLGNGLGDFQSLGDNLIPATALTGAWEAVGTMNDTWGYKKDDHRWKSAGDIIETLSHLSGRGINYLLNVGPKGDGAFPEASVEILTQVSEWMARHAEAVHGTGPSFLEELTFGPVTSKEDKLYLHLHRWPTNGELNLAGLLNEVLDVRLLGDVEKALTFAQVKSNDGEKNLSITLPARAPKVMPGVIVVTTQGAPKATGDIVQQADGKITLPASRGKIHAGEKREENFPVARGVNARLAPDGSSESRADGLKISTLGSTSDWRNTSDWISWVFKVRQPGVYRLRIVSTSLHHDANWEGGHTIRIETKKEKLTAVLKSDAAVVSVSSRHYKRAVSDIGELRLGEGAQELELHAENIVQTQSGLAILAVEMFPKEENERR